MLKDSSTLRTLSLTLRSPKGSKIGDAGAQALAMLKHPLLGFVFAAGTLELYVWDDIWDDI